MYVRSKHYIFGKSFSGFFVLFFNMKKTDINLFAWLMSHQQFMPFLNPGTSPSSLPSKMRIDFWA